MKFPREARLTRPREFQRVFAKATVSSDRCFRVLARPNDRATCRLGMAVSRRACRQAVGRARLKRLIRESFRAYRAERLGAGGDTPWLDFVVLPSGRAASMCNRTLRASLDRHWPAARAKAERAAKTATDSRKPD